MPAAQEEQELRDAFRVCIRKFLKSLQLCERSATNGSFLLPFFMDVRKKLLRHLAEKEKKRKLPSRNKQTVSSASSVDLNYAEGLKYIRQK